MSATWDEERLFFDNDAFFADLLQSIESARHSILFETYIFQPDRAGRRLEKALAAAAHRGVEVRLLVDGIGASNWIDRRSSTLETSGAQIRVYHPIYFSSLISHVWADLGLRRRSALKSGAFFSRLNRRDHRKMCIIDHTAAWIGSINVAEPHFREFVGANAWRDTAARIKGESVADLLNSFDFAWLRSHTPEGRRKWSDTLLPRLNTRRHRPSPLVRLNYTSRLRRQGFREFLLRLKRSKKRIWITNAYLAPSAPVLRALIKAARRGVDVRLLLPKTSDVFFMPWVTATYHRRLINGGVQIYEYTPCFLHAKSVIVDDWMVVGTSNMNRRSLTHDLEVDVVLSQPQSLKILEEQFINDLAQAETLTEVGKGLSGFLGRMILYFFRNWI